MTSLQKASRALIVLSGGESRRFGSKDKGLYRYKGVPLVKRVIDAVGPIADEIVVQVAQGKADEYRQVLGKGALVQEDGSRFNGPLSGLSEALMSVGSGIVLLSPCDLPNVPPALFELLISRMGSHDAAMPRINDFPEPITAAYRTEKLRNAVEIELRASHLKLSGIIDHLDVVFVLESELDKSGVSIDALRSMNTPLRS